MSINKTDPYFESKETSAEFLEAYYLNDTISLKQLYNSRLENFKRIKSYDPDSCLNQSDLRDLHVAEAYRFMYWQAFCDNALNVTISKQGDSILLDCIVFQGLDARVPCGIISRNKKALTLREWDTFKTKLDYSDFWGLKQQNGVSGLDGNGVTILGYIQGDKSINKLDKLHSVYRFWVEGTDLFNPFKEILKLSGKNLGCP